MEVLASKQAREARQKFRAKAVEPVSDEETNKRWSAARRAAEALFSNMKQQD